MARSAANEQRELAHRAGNGIEVTLLWTKSTNRVTIAVADTHSGEELEFEVDGSRALDAFNHPYAYAASVRVPVSPVTSSGTGPQGTSPLTIGTEVLRDV